NMNRTGALLSGQVVLDTKGVSEKVQHLSTAIAKDFALRQADLVLVGIQTRGVVLARRIAVQLREKWHREIPVGILDITLYRDDVHAIGEQPEVKETDIPFDLEDRPVVLIDDVLFTGRTVRSAMNALIDFS